MDAKELFVFIGVKALSVQEILDQIVFRTGFSRQSGVPLYAYKLSTTELQSLKAEVYQSLCVSFRHDRGDICAGFCLFAAEWFRRNHEDGPWKWELIFQGGLGLTGEALRLANSQANRSRMVELGFQWWNLPLVETEGSTRYLVSLACQGGLPLKTLKKDHGNLKKFFEDSLSHHERWPTEPLNDVVSRYAKSLPVSLNNDAVIQLGVLIVSAVARLRRDSKVAADSASTRMAYLDQHFPKWRDSLPLRLDDEDQDQLQLLMGLLDRKTVRPATDDFPKVETYIKLGYSTGNLERKLCAGKTIEEDGLARFLGLPDKESLRPRMTLSLLSGSVKTLVAKLAKRATGADFTINTVPGSVSGMAARNELRVTAAFGSESTPAVHLGGGQELGDIPWIFGDPDEKTSTYRLIGLGSVRTRRESVLVVVPSNATWSVEANLEILPQTVDGRKVLRISGNLDVVQDDATFRIRTKESEDSSFLYWLTGRQAVCGTGGSVVWAGCPRILEVSVDGTVQEVPSRSVQWKYEGGPNEWRTGLSGCLGNVKVRVVRDGVTAFQQTLAIFPRDFSVRVLPSDGSRGRLVMRNIGDAAKVFVAPDERLNSTVRSIESETTVEVATVLADRPDFISIRVDFENRGASELQVPCPTTWTGLIDAAGRVFAAGRPASLSSLKQLTLRVMTPRSQMPQLYSETKGHLVFLANLRTAEKDAQGNFELPMSVVETRVSGMMSATTDLDDQVHLVVLQGVSSEPIYRFSVSRYPGALEKLPNGSADGDDGDFTDIVLSEETARILRVDEEQIRIEISPLSRPDKPYLGDEFRKIASGRWRVFHDRLNSGPCLVTAWLDDFTCLRPLRVSVRSTIGVSEDETPDPSSIEEFERISRIWNGQERRSAWKTLIDHLSQNFEAPSWSCVDAMLKASEYRPMTTFEALVALVQTPLAMARIGIIHASRQWIWDRFEELPFLWCLIPIHCWARAALTIRESMKAQLSKSGFSKDKIDELLVTQLNRFLEGGVGRPSVLSAAAACLPIADTTIPQDTSYERLLPNAVMKLLHERELERTRLISSHDRIDTRISWPNYDIPIANELKNEIKDILISDCHDNQSSVLNGPLAAAAHSVYGVSVTDDQLVRFQELRGIDADWFDRCYEISSFILAGRRLKKEGRDWLLESRS